MNKALIVLFLIVNAAVSADYCAEYAMISSKLSLLSYRRDSVMEIGRKEKVLCAQVINRDEKAKCSIILDTLRANIRRSQDSISRYRVQMISVHDSCDTLLSDDTNAVSINPQQDIENMWKVKSGKDGGVSSVSSINSAVRVFNTVSRSAIGVRLDSLDSLIGKRPRPGYKYGASFWPVNGSVSVYRFDTGVFGCQFDVSFDECKRVLEIRRRWIH